MNYHLVASGLKKVIASWYMHPVFDVVYVMYHGSDSTYEINLGKYDKHSKKGPIIAQVFSGSEVYPCTANEIRNIVTAHTRGSNPNTFVKLQYVSERTVPNLVLQFKKEKSIKGSLTQDAFYTPLDITKDGSYFHIHIMDDINNRIKLTFHADYTSTGIWEFFHVDQDNCSKHRVAFYTVASTWDKHGCSRLTTTTFPVIGPISVGKLRIPSNEKQWDVGAVIAATSSTAPIKLDNVKASDVNIFYPNPSGLHLNLDAYTVSTPKPYTIQVKVPTRSNTMLNIKSVTLINGKDSADYSTEQLIEYIRQEEEHIAKLNTVKSESKAIARMKEKHQDNIKQLTELLDSRE